MPTSSREVFGKSDTLDPQVALRECAAAGIKVHFFCMVGHPGTSVDDAKRTVDYLLENCDLIDTADMVGFRLDAGTRVPGVRQLRTTKDWAMQQVYDPVGDSFTATEVSVLEAWAQERLWQDCPRLIHPLYRLAWL